MGRHRPISDKDFHQNSVGEPRRTSTRVRSEVRFGGRSFVLRDLPEPIEKMGLYKRF